jgi:hypothetical protein
MSFSRFLHCRFCLVRSAAVAIALFLFSAAANILAQEAIGTAGPTVTSGPSSQPVLETAQDSSSQPLNPVTDSNLRSTTGPRNEVSADARRFQYGLQITMRGVYDDNINITQTGHVSDYYFTIEPTLTLGLGDIASHEDNYIRFVYTPSAFLFLDHSENDAVQHLIHLDGQHRFSRLTLTMGEEVAILDGTDLRSLNDVNSPGSQPNLDVSGRTRFQTYNTKVGASYDLTGKTFLTSEVNCLATEYNSAGLISSQMLSGNLFINYRYSEKIVIGLGGTGGYDFVDDPNPDQTFEQANVRASYQATDKIALNASGGVEFRQFEHDSRSQYVSPVFELSATYQPFDGTSATLTGSRRTFNSGVLAGQDFAGTTITAGLRQRLVQRFYFGVSAGYQNSDYFNTVSGVMANRKDDYYFIEPSLDFSVTRFWTMGGYYLHRQNDSSFQSFKFDDNQVGLRTALTF